MNKKFTSALFAVMISAMPIFAQDQVKVRVIHAVPQAPAVSVKVGNTALFDNVAYKSITAFKALPEQDDQKVTLNLADGRQLKTTDDLNFDDKGEKYTVLVTPDPDGTNPKVVALKSDGDAVDPDEVEVTLINASPGHKSIKLMLNDDTEERGVNYAESDDTDVKPGLYTVKIIDTDGANNVVATKQVRLIAGAAVTVILNADNSLKVINDESPDTELGAAESGSTSGTIQMTPTGSDSMGTSATRRKAVVETPTSVM